MNTLIDEKVRQAAGILRECGVEAGDIEAVRWSFEGFRLRLEI